jgi:hypothetical protein
VHGGVDTRSFYWLSIKLDHKREKPQATAAVTVLQQGTFATVTIAFGANEQNVPGWIESSVDGSTFNMLNIATSR